MALRLGDGVERLPGIGPARAKSLEKLGLATVEDLLRGATPPLPHPQGAGAGEGPPGGRYRQRQRHLL